MSSLALQRPQTTAGGATIFLLTEEIAASLSAAHLPDPRGMASDVLAALLDAARSWPGMNGEAPVDGGVTASARAAAVRLAAGAPFAYAVRCAQFRHLTLTVDERVLIPRPETEVLVDEILARMAATETSDQRAADCRRTSEPFDAAEDGWGTAIDVGTGSGAIALSLASEGRFDRVIATDVSIDALAVARGNATRGAAALRTSVEFRHGSLLSPVREVRANVVVSNPPYVSYAEIGKLPSKVRDWEPPVALLSGDDGLAATAGIVHESVGVLQSGGLLALEVDERRASLVAEMVMQNSAYFDVGVRLDLTGRERFVFASRA